MPDLAAFDFDGTVTDGGSVFAFLAAVAGRRAVLAAGAALAPHLADAAVRGGSRADEVKESLFVRVLAGVDVDRFEDVADRFGAEHVIAHARPDAVARLRWHLGRDDVVVLVSASPERYVAAAGEVLGVDAAIATRLEVSDGRLTGHYEGRNCRGQEKMARLEAYMDGVGGRSRFGRVWAYGNSRGDRRLLASADVGVNAGRLGRLGRLGGYVPLRNAPRS